ncbi:hypothetical protein JG687_00014472 [Phytophthora cactorum]|uniref:Uncharacterized protein n=1 Tax=Phytophthora cactorum TaxID=29920 RepID=A0A8T1U1I7_9STRA|nr:hypothetical protein GQ600_13143 [Phytophthora cactorum]KAG6950061.1 hypothetical protein JG687_00014472 [Phytophthora cactorum]
MHEPHSDEVRDVVLLVFKKAIILQLVCVLSTRQTTSINFRETRFSSNLRPLSHVLKQISTFLLSPEEALVEAASTNQLDWLQNLLERYDTHIPDAVLLAASIGDVGTLEILAPLLYRPFLGAMSGEAWDVFKKAIPDTADSGYVDESGDDTSSASLHAIYGRQSEAAIILISRYYRKWRVCEGLEKALVYGVDEVAECIYRVITEHDDKNSFEDFFAGLAGEGNVNAIKFLYQRG